MQAIFKVRECRNACHILVGKSSCHLVWKCRNASLFELGNASNTSGWEVRKCMPFSELGNAEMLAIFQLGKKLLWS